MATEYRICWIGEESTKTHICYRNEAGKTVTLCGCEKNKKYERGGYVQRYNAHVWVSVPCNPLELDVHQAVFGSYCKTCLKQARKKSLTSGTCL